MAWYGGWLVDRNMAHRTYIHAHVLGVDQINCTGDSLKKKSLVDCGFSELKKHAIDSTDLPIIILRVLYTVLRGGYS
jgi:hypothetical protein